jgi:hypothetical protein
MTDLHQSLLADILQAEDASSAEETERKQRNVHRRNKLQKAAVAAVTPVPEPPVLLAGPTPLNNLAIYHNLEHVPQIMGLAELKLECPNLKEESGCRLIEQKLVSSQPSKQKSRSNMGNEQELKKLADALARDTESVTTIAREHSAQSKVIPWQIETLKKSFEGLTVGRYHQQELTTRTLTQEEIYDCLRKKMQHLPLLTSDLETCLLREAGTWTYQHQVYDWPACVNGTACYCMSLPFEGDVPATRAKAAGKKFICTSMMYDHELTEFLVTHQPPHQRRPCIVCLRITLVDYVTRIRAEGNQPDIPTSLTFEDHTRSIFQIYGNRAGVMGGYHVDYCLYPLPNEALIEPVCMIHTNLLRLRPCEHDPGRLCLDQSVLVYTEPTALIPRIGENGQHFHKGDNKQQNTRVTIPKPTRPGLH